MKIIEKLYKKYYDLTGQANRLEVLVPVYRQSSCIWTNSTTNPISGYLRKQNSLHLE